MYQRLKNRTIETASGCWEWQGATRNFGYGYTSGKRTDGKKKTISTHRAMMEAVHGSIPKSMWVLHKCDNPKCINPEHLYFGTRKDNVRDREERGRNTIPNLKHEQHPLAKLDWAKVNEIRGIKGMTQQAIANLFGVSREAIRDILGFKTWQPPVILDKEGV